MVGGGGVEGEVLQGSEEVCFGLLRIYDAKDAVADAGVEIGVEVGDLQGGFSFPEADEDVLYDVLALFAIFQAVMGKYENFFPIPLIDKGEGFMATVLQLLQ